MIFIETVGIKIKEWIVIFFDYFQLLCETIYWIIVGPFKQKPIQADALFTQMVFMGVQSILIVFFVVFFTGVVLAMQSAPLLMEMGTVFYVAGLVSVSICRELGPVLTALVIAGRIGAAITAEIGSMKVNEQLEALDTMGISPVRFLVVPKVVALFIVLPCLTILGDASGLLGGYILGVYNLNISPRLYTETAFNFLTMKDIYTGLSKAFVFAIIISTIGAYQGLKTKGGAVGVGKSTTVSVVTSFILIIIADCIMTAFYFFKDM